MRFAQAPLLQLEPMEETEEGGGGGAAAMAAAAALAAAGGGAGSVFLASAGAALTLSKLKAALAMQGGSLQAWLLARDGWVGAGA